MPQEYLEMRSPAAISVATDHKSPPVEPPTLPYARRFNVVVRGMEECSKGTSRIDKQKHDFDEIDSDV